MIFAKWNCNLFTHCDGLHKKYVVYYYEAVPVSGTAYFDLKSILSARYRQFYQVFLKVVFGVCYLSNISLMRLAPVRFGKLEKLSWRSKYAHHFLNAVRRFDFASEW